MRAVEEYRRATRIADGILSEQYATNLTAATVAREYADAAIAELEAALAAANKVIDAMEDFIDHADYHMRDGDTVSYTGPRAEEAKP